MSNQFTIGELVYFQVRDIVETNASMKWYEPMHYVSGKVAEVRRGGLILVTDKSQEYIVPAHYTMTAKEYVSMYDPANYEDA